MLHRPNTEGLSDPQRFYKHVVLFCDLTIRQKQWQVPRINKLLMENVPASLGPYLRHRGSLHDVPVLGKVGEVQPASAEGAAILF